MQKVCQKTMFFSAVHKVNNGQYGKMKPLGVCKNVTSSYIQYTIKNISDYKYIVVTGGQSQYYDPSTTEEIDKIINNFQQPALLYIFMSDAISLNTVYTAGMITDYQGVGGQMRNNWIYLTFTSNTTVQLKVDNTPYHISTFAFYGIK